MPPSVRIFVNGAAHQVPAGATLAAALLNAGYTTFRRSVSGGGRGPVCGMGTCFECRVTLDGVQGRRACLEAVRADMVVLLDA
jgi:aerobic-type carbon monoxide dehydrogenase small subunit (CoxS/CutS family)